MASAANELEALPAIGGGSKRPKSSKSGKSRKTAKKAKDNDDEVQDDQAQLGKKQKTTAEKRHEFLQQTAAQGGQRPVKCEFIVCGHHSQQEDPCEPLLPSGKINYMKWGKGDANRLFEDGLGGLTVYGSQNSWYHGHTQTLSIGINRTVINDNNILLCSGTANECTHKSTLRNILIAKSFKTS